MPVAVLDATAEPEQIERLLGAARRTIAGVRYCWAVTAAEDGGANARIVLPFAGAHGEDEWTRWFLTKRGSRKAAEIGRSGRITLAYQHDSGDAYVALAGRAIVVEDQATLRHYWQPTWDAFFPAGFAESNMVAVMLEVERIEIHARGVTPEPFGFGRTLIERDRDGSWGLVA